MHKGANEKVQQLARLEKEVRASVRSILTDLRPCSDVVEGEQQSMRESAHAAGRDSEQRRSLQEQATKVRKPVNNATETILSTQLTTCCVVCVLVCWCVNVRGVGARRATRWVRGGQGVELPRATRSRPHPSPHGHEPTRENSTFFKFSPICGGRKSSFWRVVTVAVPWQVTFSPISCCRTSKKMQNSTIK